MIVRNARKEESKLKTLSFKETDFKNLRELISVHNKSSWTEQEVQED